MRIQSRLLHLLLRLRTHHNHSQLLRSFSSIPLRFTTNQSKFPINPNFRNFSSKPILANVDADHSVIVDIFSKSRNFDEVKNQLDSNQLSITHYAVNRVLSKLDPESARIFFFQWVLENYPEKLSSESYNQVLGDLAISGAVEEFWDLIGVMKKKGFGVSKSVIDRTLEYFQTNRMDVDALKLKEFFDNDTFERLCRIVRNNVWSDDVDKEIRDMNVRFSNELVKSVLFNLGSEPKKVLMFYSWARENGVYKSNVYIGNALLRVRERKYWFDRYWELFFKDDGVMLEQENFEDDGVFLEQETFEYDGVMLQQDMEEESLVKVLQNDENTKIRVRKHKENENPSAERIQIIESDMTISKLKQLLEEKEQCILQHKEKEKKFKRRILHDHYTKQGQSTLFKRLRKSFKAAIEVLETEFQDKCQKQEKHFAETEKIFHKIHADCSKESTRQQLMMHIQQCQSEQLMRLRNTAIAVRQDFHWTIQASKDVGETFAKVFQNDENAKIDIKKLEENETSSVERFQIMESDMTISKLKQLLEEKEQCILQHKEKEKKFKCRILHDHYIKQGQSTLLKRLRKKIFRMSESFEAVDDDWEIDFQDMFEKLAKYFAETEERCHKILANCSEESTRQQLMMQFQQGHIEQLKHLRETTIAVWKDFDEVIQEWKHFLYKDYGVMLEELSGDYDESSSDSDYIFGSIFKRKWRGGEGGEAL